MATGGKIAPGRENLPRTIDSETDSQVLADPRCQNEDMEELVEAEVLGCAARLLEGVEDGAD